MDIKSIFSSLSTLIPFWSTNILIYCGIGNEYSMLINIILQQIIIPIELFLTEEIVYFLLTITVIIVVCYKNNLINDKWFKFKTIKSYSIMCSEKDNMIDYCDRMIALTKCFINEYNMKNIIYNKTSKNTIMLENIDNHKLNNNLYLSISRNNDFVKYNLMSYHIDLDDFVKKACLKYNTTNDFKYIHMYGKEVDSTYEYSQSLISITYTLVHKYNMVNLLNKNIINSSNTSVSYKDDDSKKMHRNERIMSEKKNKAIYLIDDCENYKINDDLFCTIKRIGECVKYSFFSKERNLLDFIESCSDYYNININKNKYKNRLIIQGTELNNDRSRTRNIYPKEIIALNHYLIHKHNYTNYRIIINSVSKIDRYGDNYDCEDDTNVLNYLLEDVSSLCFDDIVLTIKRYSTTEYSVSVTVDYIFESHTIKLEDYIIKITQDYSKYLAEQNKNKIYHFTLTTFDDGNPDFNKELIYDNEPLLYETFDNIFSVHNELLKKDMIKLKNINYYKKTGLKRKKSYLFYGEPGCGKTTSVIALALYDKRHIIEIPMSIIQSCSDLESIFNLDVIDDIPFNKDEIIILFDEIDIGLNNTLDKKVTADDTIKIDIADMKVNPDTYKKKADNKIVSLNLASLLSKFDGISNYNGIVFIGITNKKEQLDPALYREMRLTPLYFTFCRNEDIIGIIKKFYNTSENNLEMINNIINRKIVITPAKLTFLCEKYEDISLEALLDAID